MDLDALLARSQAPGQFVERKSFTLSRGKAMSKMRDFTLRDPEQFGLELIQAGVFAGANWVFADADKHQATIGWVGGRSIKQAELDGLLDYLFISEGASNDRHLRQLAVAVNVLMRREPLVLRIESGDGQSAVRLDLEADGTGVVGVPAEQIFGTYLHVRFSKPWFFNTKTRSKAAELIETNCLYSPVPVFVNGDGPHGWDRNLPLSNPMLHDECAFRGDGRDGWIGFPVHTDYLPPHVKLVVGGIVVSRRQIPELGDGIEGVIRDDQLAKTADMSDIVADENWNRMLHHVQPLVVDKVHGQRGQGWQPPELPPLATSAPSDEEAEDAPVDVVPLSAGLTLLGTDTLLPSQTLASFADEPLYWVESTEAREVGEIFAAAGFPGRVVVIDHEQRQAFADLLNGRRAFAIRSDDAAFVASQATKSVEVRSTSVATRIGVLHLHLHVRGRLPGWRIYPAGVPMMVLHARGRREVQTLALRLPRVSAVLELDGDVDDETATLEAVHVLERHVWALALEVGDPALTRELLAQALFLQPSDDGPVPSLPSSWPAEALGLLDLPLALDGPSARDVLALMGTPDVLVVPHATDAVAQFADRFGPGHVTGPSRPPKPLVVVQWDGVYWTQVDHPLPDVARAVLMVMDQFVVPGPDAEPTPHPLFVAGRRDPEAPVDFAPAYRLVADVLRGAPLDGLAPEQRDLLRLAHLVLDGENTSIAEERVDKQHSQSVRASEIASGAVRIGLRGGLTGTRANRILCTLDQLAHIGGTPAFYLDDPPELWAPEPDPADWLVTLSVIEPGLDGWIGLRFPYDPTGGLLLQQGLATRLVDEIEHGVRFHGRLTHTHHDDVLPAIVDHCTEVLVALLELTDLDPEREATVQRYAADFAAIARLHPQCGIPEALAIQLARRVSVGDWGHLHAWLQAPPQHRPPLDVPVIGLTGQPIDPDAELLTESSGSLVLDAMRLTLSRAGVTSRTALFVNPDGWHTVVWDSGTLSISFGGRSRVLRLADEGHRRALGITLLDAVRRLQAFEASTGASDLDLLVLQRAALEATAQIGR